MSASASAFDQHEEELSHIKFDASAWISSSQAAAEMYDTGVKLWTKQDLIDIEEQASRFRDIEHFRYRCIDGTFVLAKNPLHGVRHSIWRPYVKFQDYWALVVAKPDGPPKIWQCTYRIAWANETAHSFDGTLHHIQPLYEDMKRAWSQSASRRCMEDRLRELLKGRKATKVVCFGLGDFHRRPPAWWRAANAGLPVPAQETELIMPSLTQHAVALTIAHVARDTTEGAVRLLAQDPQYTEQTRQLLREDGFEIVGPCGAGGFAEIDDESIVMSAFMGAPLKQIIADIARPLLILATASGWDSPEIKKNGNYHQDAHSPRTKQMYQDYDTVKLKLASGENDIIQSLASVELSVRRGTDFGGKAG